MDGWRVGQVKGWTDGVMDGWRAGQVEQWTGRLMDRWRVEYLVGNTDAGIIPVGADVAQGAHD